MLTPIRKICINSFGARNSIYCAGHSVKSRYFMVSYQKHIRGQRCSPRFLPKARWLDFIQVSTPGYPPPLKDSGLSALQRSFQNGRIVLFSSYFFNVCALFSGLRRIL